ncbi:MAG: HD domain-containing protein [Prevotellaceae bacterium]|nr:HD domain-containing protein [Prevotellaceae bacterium]MDY3855978.1 HD domain-containing protein [Bacteroidaceae bacterium]
MIINDPVHGFIEIGDGLATWLVKHPVVFRLTRIRQLGPSYYVYPGGHHTRFEHSIGAHYLACKAVETLRAKGNYISDEEAEGVEMAMLLHDIGHGPMSHALEGVLVSGVSHEEISLMLMQRLNAESGGKLDLAISIFKDEYPRRFLHELIQSQLDMDRMDYLCRDSFFTGVREGNIGAARIIKMLNVKDDKLVVEWKGVYTIENYLMSRRLMYWQVYLHKTVIAAQTLLCNALRRAKQLALRGEEIAASPALAYFLQHEVDDAFVKAHTEWLDAFVALDDSDVVCAMKQWRHHPDKVLSTLADDYINRNLYKVAETQQPVKAEQMAQMRSQMAQIMGISPEEARYFVMEEEVNQVLYSTKDDHILILFKNGTVHDISESSELLESEMVDKVCRRRFLFYQRTNGLFKPQT